MSRDSSTSVTSASAASQVRYRLLCEINSLTSGSIRACNGGNFITVGANTYSPVGGFGGIDPVQEDSDIFPRAVRLWLCAVSTSQVVDLKNENLFNRELRVSRCFLTDSLTVVDTPNLVWRGRVNKVSFKTNDPERGNFYEVECESRLRRNPRARYYDQATLQIVMGHSGDTFFNFLPQIPLAKASWGQSSNLTDFNANNAAQNFNYTFPSLPPGWHYP